MKRLSVNFEQKADFSSQLKSVFGFSAWNESVYDALPGRYPATTAQSDSRDLRLRDVYLQYQSENFFLRAGNQQVVWGEAFGFFYSDIVNPKDLRYGLFGDFRDIRLQVPMLNSKLIFSDFSIQAVFIPKPYFNLIPAPGNDFAYPYASLLPVGNVVINRETSAPFMSGNEEGGGRVSTILGSWDLSAFYFNYVDRNPYYAVSATKWRRTSHSEGPIHIILLGYVCRWLEGDAKSIEVQDYKWIRAEELGQYEFAAADLPLVKALLL